MRALGRVNYVQIGNGRNNKIIYVCFPFLRGQSEMPGVVLILPCSQTQVILAAKKSQASENHLYLVMGTSAFLPADHAQAVLTQEKRVNVAIPLPCPRQPGCVSKPLLFSIE